MKVRQRTSETDMNPNEGELVKRMEEAVEDFERSGGGDMADDERIEELVIDIYKKHTVAINTILRFIPSRGGQKMSCEEIASVAKEEFVSRLTGGFQEIVDNALAEYEPFLSNLLTGAGGTYGDPVE